jgi:hypothetical protein
MPAACLMILACNRSSPPAVVVVRPAPGTLDLCIAANEFDDGPAIATASRIGEEAQAKERDRRAARGEPPLAPTAEEGLSFYVNKVDCTYHWAPLSPVYARRLGIGLPTAEDDHNNIERQFVEARKFGNWVHHAGAFYCSTSSGKNEWGVESVDYFMLIRDEPKEMSLNGVDITFTWFRNDPGAKDSVHLDAKLEGADADKLFDMTTRNRPTEGRSRMLVLIHRGKVLSEANITGPLAGGRFAYSGGANQNGLDFEELLAELRK